jgi:LPS-assembly lipoprotein
MWWHDRRNAVGRAAPLALALTLAGLVGGCFEPLYAERTLSGKPGMRQQLSGVVVDPIPAPAASPEARIAVAIRNALIFNLTGGADAPPAKYRLRVTITPSRQQVIVDITTSRPDVELVGFQASYSLTEIATNKVVVTGATMARASYDIPGQEQRFAGARGQLDAQERTAKVIADNITARLASFFITAGT